MKRIQKKTRCSMTNCGRFTMCVSLDGGQYFFCNRCLGFVQRRMDKGLHPITGESLSKKKKTKKEE